MRDWRGRPSSGVASLPCLALACLSVVAADAGSPCTTPYIVQNGDTCYTVAVAHSLTLADVLALNPEQCGPGLAPGATLCLQQGPPSPGPSMALAPAQASTSGSMLGPIAQPTTTPPSSAAAPAASGGNSSCADVYTVRTGDFCAAIATNNGLSLDEIQNLNPGKCGIALLPGETLCLKQAGTPSPPASPPPPAATASSAPITGTGQVQAGAGKTPSSSGGGLSGGAIGGIIGGVLGGLALLALAAALLLLRRRRQQRRSAGLPDGLALGKAGGAGAGLAGKQASFPGDELGSLEADIGLGWKEVHNLSGGSTQSDAVLVPSVAAADAAVPPGFGSYTQVTAYNVPVVVSRGPGGSVRIARAQAPASSGSASAGSTGTGNSQAVSVQPQGSGRSLLSGKGSGVSLPELPWSDWELRADEIQFCKDGAGEPVRLGSGAYGTVFKATIDGVTDVAVKIFSDSTTQQQQADILHEVAILKGCRDRNIVTFLGACIMDERVWLVTELMAAGDLWHALANHRVGGTLRWYRRGARIALDIARGLHFLHRHRIIHFDLKSPNVLLSREGVAKIGDCGFAAILTRTHFSNSRIGTFAWAAPEVLMGRPCSEKVDIYAYGVILWELVTGEQPMRGRMREIRVPEECPAEVDALISRCMAAEPEARPTVKEIVEELTAVDDLPPPSPWARPPADDGTKD